MRPSLAALGALTLALTGMTAVAAVAAAPQAQDDAQQEKKICRTSKATGSLTRRTRICMTEAQWRELNSRTRRGVDEMTSAASGGKECIQDERGGCR